MPDDTVSKRLLTLKVVGDAFDAAPGLRTTVDLHESVVGSRAEVDAYLNPWRAAGCKVIVGAPKPGVVRVLVDGTDRG